MRALARRVASGWVVIAGVAAILGAQVAGGPSLKDPASLKEESPARYRVRVDTNKGAFVIEVTRDWAPLGADRFYNLVKHGFYNENRFYRVVPEVLAQFGLSGDAALNVAWHDATIADDPRKQSNERSYISFVTAGPKTRTTQIAVNLNDNQRALDAAGFVPFGRVASGLAVLERLYSNYGDGPPTGKGPDQFKILAEGNAYLAQSFPRLDFIRTATIEEMPAKK
jgi:peptidyl-prolyl cis-trans isomerase A (cyclophilin A)